MKRQILAVISLSLLSSVAVGAVSDQEWSKYCDAARDDDAAESCIRAEEICEESGFDSQRCERVRESVIDYIDKMSALGVK